MFVTVDYLIRYNRQYATDFRVVVSFILFLRQIETIIDLYLQLSNA